MCNTYSGLRIGRSFQGWEGGRGVTLCQIEGTLQICHVDLHAVYFDATQISNFSAKNEVKFMPPEYSRFFVYKGMGGGGGSRAP